MKVMTLVLLLAAYQCLFGQTDTNIIAVGDWSAPVTDGIWPLRGRLLIYKAEEGQGDGWHYGRIYLELQNLQNAIAGPPLEFYFDDNKSCLHFEMHDGNNNRIPGGQCVFVEHVPQPFTITLPKESTIRVRADWESQSSSKPNGLQLSISPNQSWTIRPDSTNDYYLSGIFSPPTNYQSRVEYSKNTMPYHVWQGTLQLPKVKIRPENIRKR